MADSRFQLYPLSAPMHPEREVAVGWDHVLGTFYAEVTDLNRDTGEDVTVLAVGKDIGEITNPAAVIDAVRPYAEIPDDLDDLLAASRTSTTATLADLRSESAQFARDAELDMAINRMYSPGGYITGVQREDVTDVLQADGWNLNATHPMQDYHAETFSRGDQELEIRWAGPAEDRDTERLLSPIFLDGTPYGVGSAQQFASLVTEGVPDAHTLTARSEGRIDALLEQILGPDTDRLNTLDDSQAGGSAETSEEQDRYDDEQSGEDEGSGSGLGY